LILAFILANTKNLGWLVERVVSGQCDSGDLLPFALLNTVTDPKIIVRIAMANDDYLSYLLAASDNEALWPVIVDEIPMQKLLAFSSQIAYRL
jgi:hypothetical protein